MTKVIGKYRTHTCGELDEEDLKKEVSLCGWVHHRRDHGGVVFIDLRDRYGLTQVVFDPATPGGKEAFQTADTLRSEHVIWCKGTVRSRPEGMTNKKMKTGQIEVACTEIEVFSRAKTPPFPLEEDVEVSESVRLKYRYLDLRRAALQEKLVKRHEVLSSVRNFLNQNHFVEVETPILYKSTPEGARDFIVPSRMSPGHFYALPQSPQTLKQLLMISGMDRYYQVARCFRDEDLRADRQPEFSQVDIEVSFMNEEVFFPLMEGMVREIWEKVLGVKIPSPFPQMTYREAMDRFGSDRPDNRFGLELSDLSKVFEKSEFQVFQNALKKSSRGISGKIRAIKVPEKANQFSRKDLDDLQKVASQHGAKGLLWMKVQEGGTLQSPAAKFFSEEEKKSLSKTLDLKNGDLVLVVADQNDKTVCQSLGNIRLELGRHLGLIPPSHEYSFLWVTRFPLLEYNEEDSRYYACHHPFTSPRPEFESDFIEGKNLDQVEAAAYDLVLNGVEIAGGSLRIYRSEVQDAMFRVLGISKEEAKAKFGFFLEALQYGTPPHGGIAFGVERLVTLVCGGGPIRDVMAFPKTQKGHCLMSESPSEVERSQLSELGINVAPGLSVKK